MGDHFITDTLLQIEMTQCKDNIKDEIRTWFDKHEQAEFAKHDAITKSLNELTVSVKALTDAFAAGKGALWVIKWLAIIVTGAWAILVWAKDHLRL